MAGVVHAREEEHVGGTVAEEQQPQETVPRRSGRVRRESVVRQPPGRGPPPDTPTSARATETKIRAHKATKNDTKGKERVRLAVWGGEEEEKGSEPAEETEESAAEQGRKGKKGKATVQQQDEQEEQGGSR